MQTAVVQRSVQCTRPSTSQSWPARPAPVPTRSTCSNCRRLAPAAAFHSAAAPSPFVSLAAAEPFAASDPFLPLSSIADMRRQVNSDMDDFFSASPFSSMRWFDEMMDQQFQQMDPFGGCSLRNMRSFEDSMQQQFREMDQQFDRVFADMDRAQQKMDAEIERSLRQLQEQQPGVRIERREESASGTYRYYESIQISSGTSFTTLTPAHSTTFFTPLLFAAVVLAGAYAAVTAAFARNYDLTLYGEREKWKLLLLWPVLALSSKTFWRQFSSALRGEKVKVKEVTGGSSDSSSSS